jgi:2-polyprenyl-3-methyl-5-hydroxy-6-metoxy-1,4-benzoquinol methylase
LVGRRIVLKADNLAMKKDKILSKIINIYRDSGFFIKVYLWIRYNTCPFLAIERFIPKQGLILDYGCGYGIFSHILSILSSKREIYGFDISKTRVKEANKTSLAGKINFSSDKNQLAGIIKSADCIAMLDCLSYFSDQKREAILESFYNDLKEGAVLIIKDIEKKPSLKYFWNYFQEIIAVKMIKMTKADLLNFFDRQDMCNLLKNTGFKVKVFDLSKQYLYPHILYFCIK